MAQDIKPNQVSPEEVPEKKEEETTTPTMSTFEETEDKENVLVNKVELANILAYIEKQQKKENVSKLLRPKYNTAKVRVVGEDSNSVVVGYGKTWEKIERGGRKFLTIEVFSRKIDDCTKEPSGILVKEEMEYIKFMEEGKQLDAKIISKEAIEDEQDMGSTFKKKLEYDKYKSEETDEEVPVVVTTVKLTYTLRLPDGREVVLPEEALN